MVGKGRSKICDIPSDRYTAQQLRLSRVVHGRLFSMEARETMERKGTAVVTAELVEQGLREGSTTVREEQALRMRYGARVEPSRALPQVAEPESELADELLLVEMRLLSALKHRAAKAKGEVKVEAKAATGPKAKIVAELRLKQKPKR